MSEPRFDELHVVSDLHMGGRPGFQILREGQRLAGFIRRLAAQHPGAEVALLLNGDVIDTLAEDIAGYVAVDEAVATVQRIMADPAFSDVWAALAQFVHTAKRSLVIVVGNHDIELALPAVQRAIRTRLAGGDPAANGRIEFSTTGAGYTCRIGAARAFCIHGNEVDAWNLVDYRALSDAAREQNAGRPFHAAGWQPNAGTMMVKDVMNAVKRRYAWIDLLKPETQGAVGVLAVMDPSQASKLAAGVPILWEKVRGQLKLHGLLSADERTVPDPAAAQSVALDQMLGPNLRQAVGGSPRSSSPTEMLLRVEIARTKPRAAPAGADRTLGWFELAWDRLTGVDRPEALRRALLDWRGASEAAFDIRTRDETSDAVLAYVGGNVDFVITGHTHLARAIRIGTLGYYFNCGTWIRLLGFTDAMLADLAAFQPVYDVLANGSMQALDDAAFGGGPFVMDRTTVVSLRAADGTTVGQLAQVLGDGTGDPRVLESFGERP